MEIIEIVKRRILDIDNVVDKDMLHRRTEGLDWPSDGVSMIGLKRMENVQHCVTDVLNNNIPGDFLEAGVWKGGTCIFMKAIINAYGADRRVFVCDSFEGLPAPETREDCHSILHNVPQLSISLEQVKANFEKYGLLDDKVVFVKGWFKDTMPTLDTSNQYAVIRLDGDLYKSTMDPLIHLYDRLSVGGYMIIDDWWIPEVRLACRDFMYEHNIREEIITIDTQGTYWQKTK